MVLNYSVLNNLKQSMIVPTMTELEVKREVLTDMHNAFRFEDANANKFRRLVIKSSRFPVYFHYFHTSRMKNKWLIMLEARSKKEVLDMSRVTYIAYYNAHNGYHAIMVSWINGKPQLIFYPPHFFSRFRERCGLSETGVPLILRYFRYNSSYVHQSSIKKISETQFEKECYGSSLDGVALGMFSVNDNILFKTFVSYDMLKGEQIEAFTENERIRKEIHE